MFDYKIPKSIVIDLTYFCNFTCHYCQWGDQQNKKRKNIDLEKILLEPQSLKEMNIERVVFSGGEPLLHPNFKEITRYYSKLTKEIITISNGLLSNEKWIGNYVEMGGTGITFSLDSVDEKISSETRDISKGKLAIIIDNIEKAVQARNKGLLNEIGLNVVVSSPNCKLKDVKRTLNFAKEFNLDFVKFQPIFDDGYVSMNSPHLRLNPTHSNEMHRIGEWIRKNNTPNTNLADFWHTLAHVSEGKKLSGSSCGIDKRQGILMNGITKFCYWVNDPVYGKNDDVLTSASIEHAISQFKIAKEKCNTGNHCFCLQDIQHTWEVI